MSIIPKAIRTFIAGAALISGAVAGTPGEIPYVAVEGAMPVPAKSATGLRSRAELETFLDGVMADQIASHGLAGATVSVVKDGEIFFVKGYGYSDIETQTPMSGQKSLIRPGSVSKLFTWTAIMQLVEQGKLDLETDVNEYLTSFQIPATFDQPVTLRNLLTHTAGFEDGGLGYLMAASIDDLEPMDEFLERHMPARVRPPTTDFSDGRNAAYSNWGTALAGIIIEDVTGKGFDDYIEQHIFKPLGMNDSTFREPLPDHLAKNMAKGYAREAGVFKAQPFELVHNFGPAGSATASAPDMAKFMIAHLQNGRYGKTRILKPETAKLMHSRQFSPSPHVNGSGLGFYETRINGRRLIAHGGDTSEFHSDLNLLPEEGIGIFISYNSAADFPIRSRSFVLRAFMDRYYPAKLPRIDPPKDFAERATEYAGSYRMTRMSFTKNEKLFYSLGSIKITPSEDNTLIFTGFLGGAIAQWVEIAPDTFRRVDSDDTMAFLRDESGAVSDLTIPLPFIAAFKLKWYQMVEVHGLLLLLALIAAIGAIVGYWRNRKQAAAGESGARGIAALTGLLILLSVTSFVGCFAAIASDPIAGFPAFINVALALILLSVVGSAVVLVSALRAWLNGWFTGWGRLRYSMMALLFVLLMFSLNSFNLVGYHFG